MVYKKYIKRNGKIYGPYIYHSKRVDGKVVSEYRGGLKKPKNYINFILLFGLAVIVGFFIFLLVSSEKNISGQATLGLDANYREGESLQGKLDLSLNEGEFIPSNSKVIFENNGNIKEFELREIVSEEASEGDFYVEGEDIQGNGEGYGSKGSSEDYTDVYFELNLYTEETPIGGGTESGTEAPPEEVVETSEETTEENSTEEVVETPVEEPEEITETPIEETSEVVGTPVEEPEEIVETPTEETSEVVETPVEEPEEVIETPVEEPEEVVEAPIEETPEVVETPVEETETAPITGNFFVRLGGFFLGLTPTGQVSLELEKTVEGKVSFGEEFVYELKPGETAELNPLSVKTSSGEELEDKEIKIKIQDNKVIVTTDYAEKEKGYGKDFLGEDLVKIPINLQDLNLEVTDGDLNIKIVYGDKDILNLVSSLENGKVVLEEIPVEEPEEIIEESEINETEFNETIELNQTNQTSFNETFDNETNYTIDILDVEPLSIQEKALLLGYFGNVPINVFKSEMFKDRIIVGYKIGESEIEFSYDSKISPEILEKVMENDRIIWLRDLSKSLGTKDSSRQELDLSNFTKDNLTLKNI